MTGTITGLYLKLSVSPMESANIYYAHAKYYADQAHAATDHSSSKKLYSDQANYYLAQAASYIQNYDPENVRASLAALSDQAIVKVTGIEKSKPLSLAYHDENKAQDFAGAQ